MTRTPCSKCHLGDGSLATVKARVAMASEWTPSIPKGSSGTIVALFKRGRLVVAEVRWDLLGCMADWIATVRTSDLKAGEPR